MFQELKKFDPLIHVILFLMIIGLATYIFLTRSQQESVSTSRADTLQTTKVVEKFDETRVKKLISDAVATLSGNTKTILTHETVVQNNSSSTQTANRTSYIPMGEMYTTQQTSWTDVPGSQVYIDLKNDFSNSAYVTFEASLKVAHGNGQAFARLYDKTHNIAVDGSELTTLNNSDFEFQQSGKLNLWAGRNLYQVQIKSLNGFDVTYSSGKIKVVY